MKWGAIVAAGGHAPADLAQRMGVSRKALVSFAGQTSLAMTLKSIHEAGIEHCVTVSGEDVQDEVVFGDWVLEGSHAIENVGIGLESLSDSVDAALLIPADTPLLTADILQQFMGSVVSRNIQLEKWWAAGLTRTEDFLSRFPGSPVKSIKLKEGPHLSGALYAASPIGLRESLEALAPMRHSRKSQVSMAWKLGPLNLLSYLLGQVDMARAEKIVGRFLGGQAIIVSGMAPETCLDFDDVEEYDYLVRIFESS